MVTVYPSQFATRRTLFHVLVGCGLLMRNVSRLKLPFFFSSRRRYTRSLCDWSSDVCSSDLPVVPEAERTRLIAALAAVDCVVLFDEDTPLELIRRLKPDVLVKGADYAPDAIVGAKDVEGWGGRVVRVPLVKDQSTTSLLHKLRRG